MPPAGMGWEDLEKAYGPGGRQRERTIKLLDATAARMELNDFKLYVKDVEWERDHFINLLKKARERIHELESRLSLARFLWKKGVSKNDYSSSPSGTSPSVFRPASRRPPSHYKY